MAALPYMQLYIADYLADTMHLSTEEHGAYLLLMFNYWQTGRAIPKNRLAKIARVSDSRWAELQTALKEFFEDDGDSWVHLRIERDIETVTSSAKSRPAAEGATAYKGHIYFITSPELDVVKIGYSKNPWSRLSELRSSYGSAMSVVATIRIVVKPKISVATVLSAYKKEGDWFVKNECVKLLISGVSAGEITTVEAISHFVDNYVSNYEDYDSATTVPATPTTNKDIDTDTDLKENPEREECAQNEFYPPLGKFPIADNWVPSAEFVGQAAQWGINLGEQPGYTEVELQQFRDYWKCEGKVKHHIQWEQTFATSLKTSRAKSAASTQTSRRQPAFGVSTPSTAIPPGFRG